MQDRPEDRDAPFSQPHPVPVPPINNITIDHILKQCPRAQLPIYYNNKNPEYQKPGDPGFPGLGHTGYSGGADLLYPEGKAGYYGHARGGPPSYPGWGGPPGPLDCWNLVNNKEE